MKRGKSAAGRSAVEPISSDGIARNAILAGLGEKEKSLLIEHGSIVPLRVRSSIYSPETRIEEVYFPIDCVLSVVTRMKDGNMIEIGTIGREGVSAIPLLLGARTSANECYAQVPGAAVKIDAALFQRLRDNTTFRQFLDRYVQAYVNMLGQLAACNRLHTVYERCSRWLLMTHDRVESDTIELTHEYLGMMLGTQRSGVTIAAGTLQQAGFISYAHGVITILNRAGLEGASCECYEAAQEQFAGLLRPPDYEKLRRKSGSGRPSPRRQNPRR